MANSRGSHLIGWCCSQWSGGSHGVYPFSVVLGCAASSFGDPRLGMAPSTTAWSLKVVKGLMASLNSWTHLARRCLLPGPGRLAFSAQYWRAWDKPGSSVVVPPCSFGKAARGLELAGMPSYWCILGQGAQNSHCLPRGPGTSPGESWRKLIPSGWASVHRLHEGWPPTPPTSLACHPGGLITPPTPHNSLQRAQVASHIPVLSLMWLSALPRRTPALAPE